jgi:nicotinic acid mononucleotide adenylyltransferase
MARRIAVYGGSFNPFGNHHMDIIRWLAEEEGFRTILVVPAAAHALKDGLLEFMHRYNMAKLGVNHLRYTGMPSLPQHTDARVSMVEMDMLTRQAAPIRTYELLKELAQGYGPDDEIKFAIGPDIPDEMHKWHNVDKIEEEFGFIHLPIQSMRATKLRQMIEEGVTAWHGHVPLPVRRYIERHGLYQKAAA